ncbi:MAG: HAD-IA family hydrolase [Candidatus Magasanikbacteria bacterium]|nr:HAD-IA family hydrolase [Candidatus Magasanikbacteria bacterium]
MNSIKAIFIDFHGVLLRGDYTIVTRMLAKKHGLKWPDLYQVLYFKYFLQAAVGRIAEREIYTKTFQELGWQDEDWRQAHAFHRNAMKINNSVRQYLRGLQKRGYLVVLLTANTAPQTKWYIQKFALKKNFPHIINTVELRLSKSGPEIMRWLQKKFNIKPSESLVCDDQERNLIKALQMGFHTIWNRNFKQFRRDMVKQ